LLKNINIPTPVEIAISAMAKKSKIVAAPIGNQLGGFLSKMGNKTYQLLYRENKRHKAVLKTM
jgi:hypothetical protein